MSNKHRQTLDALLEVDRKTLEATGVDVSGYSGGSPEGDVWQFSFTSWWTLEPEIAAVTVRGNWIAGYDPENSSCVTFETVAEVFRRGAPSRIRDNWRQTFSVAELAGLGLLRVIDQELKKGVEKLLIYNITLNPDVRQKPLAV